MVDVLKQLCRTVRLKRGLDLCTRMVFLGALIGVCPSVYAATIDATVDRDVVSVDESFQLIFSTEDEVPDPDFSPLTRDFEILDQSRSQNLSIVNGVSKRQYQWRLVLIATKPGELRIPAIGFGTDQSRPLTVTVKPATAGGETREQIFLEVAVDVDNPYVQQQVIYTVRVFRSVQIQSATLTEPEVAGPEVIRERLGEDKEYQTDRGGRQYLVVERKYALFPQQSGRLEIKPLVFQGQLVTRGNTTGFSIFGRAVTRPVRVRSKPLSLDIRPVPAMVSGPWLPARRLELKEKWPSGEIRIGEPITRGITLSAVGLTAAQLPNIEPGYPDGLKHYPEPAQLANRTDPAGVIGSRAQTAALVPTATGRIRLPAIQVSWWNVEQDRPETASIPERTIQVTGAPDPQPGVTNQDRTVSDAPRPVEALTGAEGGDDWWPWVSALLACAWLVTLGLWWRQRRGPPSQSPMAETMIPDTQSALKELRAACVANDPDRVKDALLQWGAASWPDSPARNLGSLADRCDPDLASLISAVDESLYGRTSRDPDGMMPLFQAVRDFKPPKTAEWNPRIPALQPLYPIH